jgi:multiple sugar transport system substrate-binding protein
MDDLKRKGTPTRLSRRQFLILSGQGVLALGVLAGCAAVPAQQQASAPVQEESNAEEPAAESGGSQAPAAAPVQLEFLAWGDTADIPAWDQLKALYEEQNPGTTIQITAVSDPGNNYYPKLQTSIAGGAIPHIASFQGWEWQVFSDAGALAPIDEFITRDNFTAPYPDDIPVIDVSTKRKGSTYLIPLQIATMVMFYTKKPFDEAGIPYPTNDWTFDEFMDMAQKVTNTSGETKMYGLQANGIWPRDIHWIRATGLQEFDELVDPKKSQFNQPEIVDMLQLVAQDVYYKLNIAPTPADMEGGVNTLETGNVAMKYEGPWFFGRLNSPELREQNKQIEFDVVLMPKGADDSRPHRGWAEGIALPVSDNVEAAWGFAHFMGDEEGNKLYSEITGRIPNTSALVESFWLPTIKERFGVENGQTFLEAFRLSEVDVIGGVNRTKMWSEVVKPIGYDPLLGNSATAAEVLPKVDEGVQRLLDEYWESVG